MIKERPKRLEMVYISYPTYYVTFCTRDRTKIPSLESAQKAIELYRRVGIEKSNIHLNYYVVMPDHVHVLVHGNFGFDLSSWVGGLKRAISKGIEAKPSFWQPGFFDRVLRSEESAEVKWFYLRDNPVRAGLVRHFEDWPFRRLDLEDAADTAASTGRKRKSAAETAAVSEKSDGRRE